MQFKYHFVRFIYTIMWEVTSQCLKKVFKQHKIMELSLRNIFFLLFCPYSHFFLYLCTQDKTKNEN